MVATATGNRKGYTNREFAAVTESQEGMAMVGNTLDSYYMNMVCSGFIRNCPVTHEYFTIAKTNFGPDVLSPKVKTTIKVSDPVITEYVDIPQNILDLNKAVNMGVYVMFSTYWFFL